MRDDRGVALVEFALVAPVLILTLAACLDFARALNAYVTVANASREGAYYASVHPGVSVDAVRAVVAARVAPLDPSRGVLGVALTPFVATDARWVAGTPRPGTVSVDVSYRWQAATSLVGAFFAAAGSATFDVSSTMESIQ